MKNGGVMKTRRWIFFALMQAFSLNVSAQELGGRMDLSPQNQQGSLLIRDPMSDFMIGLDYNQNVKVLNFFLSSDDKIHNFSGGFFSRKDGIREGTALRGKYALELPIVYGQHFRFFSESSFAGGILDAKYVTQRGNSRFEFKKFMFGSSQYFVTRLKSSDAIATLKAGGEVDGSTLSDDYGALTQWNSYGFALRGDATVRLMSALKLRLEADALRKRYNPESYFFVEKWTNELEVRSALVVSPHHQWDVIPSFNYARIDIERDRRPDLERPEFGTTVVRKDAVKEGWAIFAKGLYAPWRHKKGRENVISFGVHSSTISIEAYRKYVRDEYSTFALKELLHGIRISWKFGRSERVLKNADDYGHSVKYRNEFYRESGRKDDLSLNLAQQAERLGTLRKQNEWSFNWSYAPETYWDPLRAYAERKADCDGQQCPNNIMHTLNGYRSYVGAWFDFNTSFTGHAVGLIQDPTNGEWYWQEYGMLAKVRNVNAGTAPTQVFAEALKQNHRFSALPLIPGNTQNAYYELINCNDPQTYQFLTAFIAIGSVPNERLRPNIEYGHELFTKRNFLFDYGRK